MDTFREKTIAPLSRTLRHRRRRQRTAVASLPGRAGDDHRRAEEDGPEARYTPDGTVARESFIVSCRRLGPESRS